jgi:Fe2+ or Zn2+ uptake regulation protein
MADLEGTGAPEDALSRASATGFVPDHAQLVVWGLCPDCATAA